MGESSEISPTHCVSICLEFCLIRNYIPSQLPCWYLRDQRDTAMGRVLLFLCSCFIRRLWPVVSQLAEIHGQQLEWWKKCWAGPQGWWSQSHFARNLQCSQTGRFSFWSSFSPWLCDSETRFSPETQNALHLMGTTLSVANSGCWSYKTPSGTSLHLSLTVTLWSIPILQVLKSWGSERAGIL